MQGGTLKCDASCILSLLIVLAKSEISEIGPKLDEMEGTLHGRLTAKHLIRLDVL